MKYVRGIVNNNPANIRRGSAWKGLVTQVTNPLGEIVRDKSFCQFSSMEYGVRALLVVLRTYFYRHKINTIEKCIFRFAPLCENNSYAYIANVTKFINDEYRKEFAGASAEYVIGSDFSQCWFFNPQTPTFFLRCFARAICKQETGYFLTDEMLDKAISLL